MKFQNFTLILWAAPLVSASLLLASLPPFSLENATDNAGVIAVVQVRTVVMGEDKINPMANAVVSVLEPIKGTKKGALLLIEYDPNMEETARYAPTEKCLVFLCKREEKLFTTYSGMFGKYSIKEEKVVSWRGGKAPRDKSLASVVAEIKTLIEPSTADTSGLFEMNASVRFQVDDDFTYLHLDDDKRSIIVFWSTNHDDKEYHHYPFALSPGASYTFTIYEKPLPLSGRDGITHHSLVRVMQGRKVIFDRSICEIHHSKMVETAVPIKYGLIMQLNPTELPELEPARSLFPHYQRTVRGGCIRMSEKTRKIWICPDCKIACEKWAAEKSIKLSPPILEYNPPESPETNIGISGQD